MAKLPVSPRKSQIETLTRHYSACSEALDLADPGLALEHLSAAMGVEAEMSRTDRAVYECAGDILRSLSLLIRSLK